MLAGFGKGKALLDFVENSIKIKVPDPIRKLLLDEANAYYEYDLLGLLKSGLVRSFYINADAECPKVDDLVEFSLKTGAIISYAYLGDIESSVTGDKAAQKFEDEFVDDLFSLLDEKGIRAVSYMPTRNTIGQLYRVKALCGKHGFLEICGDDINSPRQSFICGALNRPEFRNLIDTTWALIGHEKLATEDPGKGFFSPETEARFPDLEGKIKYFMENGKSS
jgi:hypothetical protein